MGVGRNKRSTSSRSRRSRRAQAAVRKFNQGEQEKE